MKYKLVSSAKLKHDETSDNYHLFCIESGNHVRVNHMGYGILILLEDGRSLDEIALSIRKEYDVDLETCKKDVNDFFHFLSKNGFIQR